MISLKTSVSFLDLYTPKFGGGCWRLGGRAADQEGVQWLTEPDSNRQLLGLGPDTADC
jgi:hypothetical protein